MLNISELITELLAAVAFAMLWNQDRRRLYLLWWALAQVFLVATANAIALVLKSTPAALPYTGLPFAFSNAMQCVAFIAGILDYRGIAVARKKLVALSVATFAVMWLPLLFANVPLSRLVSALVLLMAFALNATLLWPMGKLERYAAICFALRAIGVVLLISNIGGAYPRIAATTLLAVPSVAIATALLLLLTAFNRAQAERDSHYQFLALSHEITAALQGITDEKSLGNRVIAIFLERMQWTTGALLTVSSDGSCFDLITTAGKDASAEDIAKYARIPFDSGLSGLALRTQEVCYASDVTNDPRVSSTIRALAQTRGSMSQMCIPLISQGEALGVLLLRDNKQRIFLSDELQTMASLGQVIGLSLANARNLRTLTYRANHDSLTGLGNRAALHDYFLTQIGDQPCTLMLFDLDHFKEVNDALGHGMGDQLLCALATRLQEQLANDTIRVFRLGGDEFVVIYPDASSSDDNIQRARGLSELIAQPIYIADLCLRTAAAVGIAEAPTHGSNSHELLRCADLAMYQAKHSGAGVASYDETTDTNIRERLELLSGVDDGLARGEFELYYQPYINLRDGSCSGCEALLRWNHPQRGLLNAGAFMPYVEATDLIRPVTREVIEMATRDAAAWLQRGLDMKISINLSARNILDPDLPGLLSSSVRQHRLSPQQLQLEITETILMKDPVTATSVMQRLVDAGFTIALDDFGTGYSSLAYLARFPIHTLKIDQSFVRNMIAESQSRGIVESTVTLAHTLGLKLTAEGVETAAEAELLHSFACDNAQGYFYSRPIPKAAFETWYRTRTDITHTASS